MWNILSKTLGSKKEIESQNQEKAAFVCLFVLMETKACS